MTPAARDRSRVRTPILLITATAWLLLLFPPGGAEGHAHHTHHEFHAHPGHDEGLATFAAQILGHLALDWPLMFVAMMLPLMAPAVCHVRSRSLSSRRIRSVGVFLISYAAIWMFAGAILTGLAVVVGGTRSTAVVFAVSATLGALVWQSSPFKQQCLNRGHAHPELAAFGVEADLDALRFGVTHGAWCVGSCWALMFLPMLFVHGHLPLMVLVTLWIWGEHLERPRATGWALRVPAKAVRLIINQTRMFIGSVSPLRRI